MDKIVPVKLLLIERVVHIVVLNVWAGKGEYEKTGHSFGSSCI
jgi:hypothetical protein